MVSIPLPLKRANCFFVKMVEPVGIVIKAWAEKKLGKKVNIKGFDGTIHEKAAKVK